MEGNGAVGSGEASPVGLIPRFVDDLFTHLAERQQHQPPQQAGNTVVSASFLEIYGEDVYDLLDDSADGRGRPSLPIREDVNAGVMVSGLKQVAVSTRAEALQVLRKGTMNRTTAATLMNVVSSRSHAVFTVTLQQTLRTGSSSSSAGGGGGEDEASVEGEAEGQVVVSKLTFVDLAGSERLKRTGAEGERRREGIQINVGLLALGSVINALADEERLVKGKKSVHVPYRQSKLTRLLQDALGGNSQTLFLACVSPADINASETLSTLYYANRARNIRNKPVKNTDSVKEELRCLRQTAHFLKAEMVRQKFLQPPPPPILAEGEEADAVSVASSVASVPQIPDSELMERADVKAFLEALGAKLDSHLRRVGIEGVDGSTLLLKPFAPATPGGNRHSPAPWGDASHSHRVSYFAPTAVVAASRNALPPTSPPRGSITQGMGTRLDFESAAAAAAAATAAAAAAATGGMEGGSGPAPLLSLPAAAAGAMVSEEVLVEVEGDPEKELALLEKLRELQQHEAAMGAEEEQGREALATVEGELEQKEGLLEQLRQTLEGYHGMRSRYERLLKDVEALEMEKEALHYQLEQALVAEQQQQQQQQQHHQRHKSGGGAAAAPAASASTAAAAAAAATALREKLKGVEAQLDRLKVQKKQQENLQRLAERQKQELLALEENLGKLKNVRAGLMKKQKETSKKHEALIQQKRREMEALRKADRTLQKKMGRLQLENRGAKVLLDRKESCIRTLKQKAAKAETHVLRLLQLQNRNREAVQQRRTTAARRGAGLGVAAKKAGGTSSSSSSSSSSSGEVVVNEEKVGAARFLIEKLVEERLGDLETRRMLEQKTRDYGQLVQELRTQAQALESLKAGGEGEGEEEEEDEEVDEAIREAEARLEGLDVEMELCAAAIAELQARLESYDASSSSNSSSSATGRNNSPSKHGRKPSSSSSSSSSTANLGLNEEAALKAVSELGSAEAKVLLAGLMEGMVEARAKVWELESDVQKKACAEEGLRIDRTRLERRLSESARGFEQKVVDLKCQHQQDLMTLVRSGVGASAATTMTAGGKTTTRMMTRAAAKGLLAQAGAKSEEDEMEMENEREREEEEEEEEDREDQVAKRQFEALVAQNDSLEARCHTLAGALDQATAAKEKLEREAEAAHREARELREALEALRAADDRTEEQRGEGGVMEELLEAWAELGISEERRKSLLDKVTQAPSNVCQNLLEEARRQRAQVKSEVVELKEELGVLARLLDRKAMEEEEEEEEGEEGGTHQNTEEALVMLRDELQVRHVQATSVLQGRLQQARRLVREAEKLQRSVGGEPRPALVDLLRLGALLVASAEEGGEDAMEEEGGERGRQENLDMIKVLEAATEAGRGVGRAVLLLSEEKLQEWEGEIKAMRRARSAMVLELQGLLERGHGACSLMDMSAESLKDTIQATLERGKHQQPALPPPQSPQQQPYAPSPFSSPAGGGTPRLITLTSPRPHRRNSITPPTASVVSWESPSLHKMIAILTSGGGGATVAGLWAAEDQAVSLADAIPQARFLVDVLVECWNRRRELLVLCWSTADAVKNCVVGEGLEGLAEGVCLTLPEADGEEGEVQNGGLSAEEAEAFVAGLDVLLAGVEEEGRATRATLEGLWDLLRVPVEERSTALSLRPVGAAGAAAAAAGEQPQQQHADGSSGSDGRGPDVAAAFRRLQADLERAQVNTRGRLEVEAWIGQVLERICQQVQALQSGLETLEAQQELVHVLGERRRRHEGILKLNDEIVGLEGRARRFETEASDRTRLVDRKTNSARLLKEEKFRKDSKNRFARLLERLRQELEEWEAQEGVVFDQSLLGEDIQRALSHSLESGGRSWVEGRTELMHLHTSQPKSRNSSPNQLSPPLLVEEEVVAAPVPPPQAPPPTKRDPFARVLSPTAATAEATTSVTMTPEGPSAVAAATTAAAAPRDGRGMGGGLLGLNRLTGAGASVSDLLVRGKHIQHSTAPHAVDGLHSKKHRKGGGGSGSSSSSSSSSSDTGGPGVSSACCRRGARGEQENIAKNY